MTLAWRLRRAVLLPLQHLSPVCHLSGCATPDFDLSHETCYRETDRGTALGGGESTGEDPQFRRRHDSYSILMRIHSSVYLQFAT
jgi:hypothetical protein